MCSRFHLVARFVVVTCLATLDSIVQAQLNQQAQDIVTQLNTPIQNQTRFRENRAGGLTYLGAPPGRAFESRAPGSPPAVAAQGFLESNAAAFGLDHSLSTIHPKSNRADGVRSFARFTQRYNDIPVFGAGLSVQLNAQANVEAVFANTLTNTSAIDNGALSLVPTLNQEDAELFARADLELKLDVDELFAEPGTELHLYDPSLFNNPGPIRLVWTVVLAHNTRVDIREQILIDAHTGDTVVHISLIHAARNRLIYDAQNVSGSAGSLARSEGDPATGTTEVDNAYDYLGDTYDYFFNNHGRDSLDDNGYTLQATVRYCDPGYSCPFANAFWDGTAMYFGDGFAAADDVVGHELTHGLTSNTADLIYFSQSGAINEALSDIFGEFIDITNGSGTDTAESRWLMGEDVPGFGAIRSMKDPTVFGHPDRHCSPSYHWDYWDNQGVHINSGVVNKLAYLLVDGDTFNGQTVSPIGRPATSELFYHAQVNLLNESSDFVDLYDALTQAAINLNFGVNQRAAVESACLAVEISANSACSEAPENDDCVNAIPISEGIQLSDSTYYSRGTFDVLSDCGFADVGDVWYSFVPPVDGTYFFSTAGSSLSTTLQVMTGCEGSVIACSADNSSGLELALTSNETYLIRVGGDEGMRGDFNLIVQISVGADLETIPGLGFDLSTDPGWSTDGQWAFGQPAGLSGDPSSGATGSNVYGYNLSGEYPNDLPAQYLMTDAMDFSGETGVFLEYQRWLGVEGSYFDNASIEVSNDNSTWSTVWANANNYFDETSWTTHSIDLSGYADNESDVRVRWVMGGTDFSVTYHGWNIDDIEFKRTVSVELTEAWVDFTNLGTQLGNEAFPFRTVEAAVEDLTSDGSGVVKVKGWKSVTSTDEAMTITKPLRIEAINGSITIGEAP